MPDTNLRIIDSNNSNVVHPESAIQKERNLIFYWNGFCDYVNSFFRGLGKVLSVSVKIFDVVDDIWGAIARSFTALLPLLPLIVGVCNFIQHSYVSVTSALKIKKAYENKDTLNRTSKIGTNSFTLIAALSAVGMAIAYTATYSAAIAASIPAAPFFPIAITAIMTVILSVQCFQLYKNGSAIKNRLEIIEKEIVAVDRDLSNYKKRLGTLVGDNKTFVKGFEAGINRLENRKKKLLEEQEKYQKNDLINERKYSHKKWEILASSMVTVGVTIGVALSVTGLATATIAGSALTLGALPLAIIVGGAILGILVKLNEIDEEKKYTQTAYNYVKNKVKNFLEPTPTQAKSPKVDTTMELTKKFQPNNESANEHTNEHLLLVSPTPSTQNLTAPFTRMFKSPKPATIQNDSSKTNQVTDPCSKFTKP